MLLTALMLPCVFCDALMYIYSLCRSVTSKALFISLYSLSIYLLLLLYFMGVWVILMQNSEPTINQAFVFTIEESVCLQDITTSEDL